MALTSPLRDASNVCEASASAKKTWDEDSSLSFDIFEGDENRDPQNNTTVDGKDAPENKLISHQNSERSPLNDSGAVGESVLSEIDQHSTDFDT
eukprot:3931235-Ditylum_brightwellii.AAC.1